MKKVVCLFAVIGIVVIGCEKKPETKAGFAAAQGDENTASRHRGGISVSTGTVVLSSSGTVVNPSTGTYVNPSPVQALTLRQALELMLVRVQVHMSAQARGRLL